jgi:hypothetical protein
MGTALQKQLEELKGFWGKVNGLAADGDLPHLGVEYALPESNPHQRSKKNLGNSECFAKDFRFSRAF